MIKLVRKASLCLLMGTMLYGASTRLQAEEPGVVRITSKKNEQNNQGLIRSSSIQLVNALGYTEINLPPAPPATDEVGAQPVSMMEPVPDQHLQGLPVTSAAPCPNCPPVHCQDCEPVECEDEDCHRPCLGASSCGLSFCATVRAIFGCDDECENGHDPHCQCQECQHHRRIQGNCITKHVDGLLRLDPHNPGRFGYFTPRGGTGQGVPWVGHYGMVYPVNPTYFDQRDGGVYAAAGYGIPMAVPLAPVVRSTYNYGWGIPSSRLTPVANDPYVQFPKTALPLKPATSPVIRYSAPQRVSKKPN